jgi:hypothetical protein
MNSEITFFPVSRQTNILAILCNIPSNLKLIQGLKAKNEKLKNDLLETQQKVIELFEKLNT